MVFQWLNERCHFVLEFLVSFVFMAIRTRKCMHPDRFFCCAVLLALLPFAGLVYGVGMHVFLIKQYWLKSDEKLNRSVGLFAMIILYISGTCTYPLILFYLIKGKFAPTFRKGFLALPCVPRTQDESCSSWLSKLEEAAAETDRQRSRGGSIDCLDNADINRARNNSSSTGTTGHTSFAESSRRRNYGTVGRAETLQRSRRDDASDRERSRVVSTVNLQRGDSSENSDDADLFTVSNAYDYCSLWNLVAVTVGVLLATSMVTFDLQYQRMFDQSHIRHFFHNQTVPAVVRGLYWTFVWFGFYGVYASVLACCIFHSMTVIERRAIRAAAVLLPLKKNLPEARRLVGEVRNVLKVMSRGMSYWFFVHNICFFLLMVVLCVEWVEASQANVPKDQSWQLWGSQFSATAIIVFKFVFPVWSASRVTRAWNKAVVDVNCSETELEGGLLEQQALVNYMKQSKLGFTVFDLRVSDNLLLIVASTLVAVIPIILTIRTQ